MARSSAAEVVLATVTARPIGIAGLDALGLALARRLTDHGLRVIGWDRDPVRRRALAGLGPLAEDAPGTADLGFGCDVVLSTLAAPELFTAALGERDRAGFAPEMAPGSLIIDMGLAMPSDAQQLAVLLGRGGIGLVDAPALGDPALAATGGLAIHAAGFGEFVERLLPLLQLFGRVQPAGTVGRGHALAAVMTFARRAEADAAREALRVGLACGLAPELMPTIVAAASAGPPDDDPRLAIARRMAAETFDGAAPVRAATLRR